jgi:hypothetical protein
MQPVELGSLVPPTHVPYGYIIKDGEVGGCFPPDAKLQTSSRGGILTPAPQSRTFTYVRLSMIGTRYSSAQARIRILEEAREY